MILLTDYIIDRQVVIMAVPTTQNHYKLLSSLPSTSPTFSPTQATAELPVTAPSDEAMQGIQCTMCRSTASRYCPTCKATGYCSKTCEKTDEPVHKLLCRAPGNKTYRNYYGHLPDRGNCTAVLFPEKEKTPYWVSFKSSNSPDDWEYEDDFPHPATQILKNKGLQLTITGNALRSRSRTDNKLEVYYITKHCGDTSGLNLSILACTNERPAQSWFGPVLAVKVAFPATPQNRMTLPQYLNMDMVDFRDVIDLLCTHPATNISDMSNLPFAASPKAEVSAVRINCPGDLALGRPPFELLQIRADDAACHAPVTAISRLIGFPLRVSRCPHPFTPGYEGTWKNVDKPAATYLQMGVNPASDWGFVGLDWVDSAGSVVVVRDGGEQLNPQHVEALCHWCLFVIRPLFQDSIGMGIEPEDPMEKDRVLGKLVKQEWLCFYRGSMSGRAA